MNVIHKLLNIHKKGTWWSRNNLTNITELGNAYMYQDNPYLRKTTANAKKNGFTDAFYVVLGISHMYIKSLQFGFDMQTNYDLLTFQWPNQTSSYR